MASAVVVSGTVRGTTQMQAGRVQVLRLMQVNMTIQVCYIVSFLHSPTPQHTPHHHSSNPHPSFPAYTNDIDMIPTSLLPEEKLHVLLHQMIDE